MDFKWTLSRPGISLEFETGSVKEAIGLLEQEGTQISEVFGFALPARAEGEGTKAVDATAAEPKTRGRPKKPAPEAVAPDPLPIPTAETAPPLVPTTATALPPNQLNTVPGTPPSPINTEPNANGIPTFLDRAPPPPLPSLPSSPPPVGLLGPKMVAALDEKAKASPDGGQGLADWLAACGLTIKGAKYSDACRAVLMISDEKLAPAAAILGL